MKLGKIFILLALFSGTALSFTSFYGTGFLIFISLGALYLTLLKAFKSYFSRLVLASLLLAVSIMLSGLLAWLVRIPLPPIAPLIVYAIFVFLLRTKQLERPVLIDKSDIVSLLMSVIAPVILLLSFSTSAASIFQIASEGWDNGSHVLMLEDAARHKGYLYGPLESLKGTIIQESNAYPQAWHLATATMTNGFGVNAFNPNHEIRTMYAYIAVTLLWMMVACYLFVKTSWYIVQRFAKKDLSSFQDFVIFSAITLIIQMIVMWGAFVSGFSNYVGMIAYVCLLIAALVNESSQGQRIATASSALIFAVAATLCWFLPGPALLVMAIVALPLILGTKSVKSARTKLREHPSYYVPAGLLISLSILQVLVFVLFSTTGGDEQLNTGVPVSATDMVNGVFPVSQLFFTVITLVALVFWLRSSLLDDTKKKIVMTGIVPLTLLSVALYIYQNVTSGTASYYLPKLMGVALIPIGMFAAAALILWLPRIIQQHLKLSRTYVLVGSLLIIGIGLLCTNQSAFGAMKLLKKNTRVGEPTAEVLVDHLRNADHSKTNIIVLRDNMNKKYEDINGKFESRVIHRRLNCSYDIIKNGHTLEMRLERLAKCADKLAKKNRQIVVVTSDRTEDLVRQLHKSNIIIKNVKEDE